MTLILVTGGCVTDEGYRAQPGEPQTVSKESKSESARALSPLEAHLRARRMVDPSDTRTHHEYTSLVIPPGEEPPLPPRKPEQKNKFMAALTDLIRPETPAPESEMVVPESKPEPGAKAVVGAKAEQTGSARDDGYTVSDVRIGTHPDKTRFVFDLSGPAGFEYEMSADGRLLTVTLSGTDWNTSLKRNYFSHPYVSGYTARSRGRDTVVKFTMKRAVKFMKWDLLPPDSGRSHRIYFDITPK